MGLFAASGMLAPVAGGYDLEHVRSRSKLTALTARRVVGRDLADAMALLAHFAWSDNQGVPQLLIDLLSLEPEDIAGMPLGQFQATLLISGTGARPMAVELIAAWLLREAYKLIVVPVGTELRQRLDGKIADRIAASVPTSLFHAQPPGNDGERANESEAKAGLNADTEFVDALEKEPEVGDALRGELEGVLGVSLGGVGVRRGTPEWYVSAYAAILWRIAMLAVWENRPIAINGALQGTEWVTVSVPLVQQAIVPSKMWRRTDDGTLLRALGNPQVEFFVRQIEDERSRQHEVADLNERFMIAPKAGFKHAEGTSVATDWHRIDGLSRKWVRLKLDPAVQKALIENTSTPGLFGEPMFIRNLTTRPPEFDEYPTEWKPLLTIPSEAHAIAVLSAGADAFARASDASADAVEAVLSASL